MLKRVVVGRDKNKLVSRLFADTIVPIGLVRSVVVLSTVLLGEHSPESEQLLPWKKGQFT